jgi:hypothetical protein
MNSANELIYIYRKSVKDDEDEKEEEAASHEVQGNGNISSCLDMSIHESCLLLFTFVFLISSSIVFCFQNLPLACLLASYLLRNIMNKTNDVLTGIILSEMITLIDQVLTHTHIPMTPATNHTHIPTTPMTTTHAFQPYR